MNYEQELTMRLYAIAKEKYSPEMSERNHQIFAEAHLYTHRMLRDILYLLKGEKQ